MSYVREVPVFYGAPPVPTLCASLREHGVVVIEEVRTAVARLAADVEAALEVDHDSDSDDAPFLLHLSAPVDPVTDYGWVDYLVYSGRFDGCPLRAKKLVAEASRRWKAAGQPDYYLARLHG